MTTLSTGGGVALFVTDNMGYTIRNDLNLNKDFIECLFVELDKDAVNKPNNIIVGVLYRPPNTDIELFNDHISQVLASIKGENKILYLLGDYNIDLLNIDRQSASQDSFDIMCAHSLYPSISKPTRVTPHSATIIDNIFTNTTINNPDILSGILCTDISDHYPVFLIDHSTSITSSERAIKRRIFSEENITKFNSLLSNHDWKSVFDERDPQQAYTTFYTEFNIMYDTCFPLRTIKPGYKTRKPWLSEQLKRAIKIKNRMYKHLNKKRRVSSKKYLSEISK